jgi:hypothetical protein
VFWFCYHSLRPALRPIRWVCLVISPGDEPAVELWWPDYCNYFLGSEWVAFTSTFIHTVVMKCSCGL